MEKPAGTKSSLAEGAANGRVLTSYHTNLLQHLLDPDVRVSHLGTVLGVQQGTVYAYMSAINRWAEAWCGPSKNAQAGRHRAVLLGVMDGPIDASALPDSLLAGVANDEERLMRVAVEMLRYGRNEKTSETVGQFCAEIGVRTSYQAVAVMANTFRRDRQS